jgi:serine/threonine-protein kinase PpkA
MALEMVYKHLRAPIPRLAPELLRCQPILDRLLAKQPEDRYQSARELIEDVKSRLPDILAGVDDAATVPLLQPAAA